MRCASPLLRGARRARCCLTARAPHRRVCWLMNATPGVFRGGALKQRYAQLARLLVRLMRAALTWRGADAAHPRAPPLSRAPLLRSRRIMGALFSCLGDLCNTLANAVQTCFRSIGACCGGIVDAIRNCVNGCFRTMAKCCPC